MSLLPYKVTALARVDNGDLNIIPGASVTVLTSGGAYAQLYEADETTPILNPFNCDENGERQIYLSGGSYTISVAGGQSWEIRLSGASDIQSVATIADLRTFQGESDGRVVTVANYTESQPNILSGEYYRVTDSTLADNGRDVIAVTGTNIRWLLNVRDNIKSTWRGNSIVRHSQTYSTEQIKSRGDTFPAYISFAPDATQRSVEIIVPIDEAQPVVAYIEGDFSAEITSNTAGLHAAAIQCSDLDRSDVSSRTVTVTAVTPSLYKVEITPGALGKPFIGVSFRFAQNITERAVLRSLDVYQGGRLLGRTFLHLIPPRTEWLGGGFNVTVPGIISQRLSVGSTSEIVTPNAATVSPSGGESVYEPTMSLKYFNETIYPLIPTVRNLRVLSGTYYNYRSATMLTPRGDLNIVAVGGTATFLCGVDLPTTAWTLEHSTPRYVYSAAYDYDGNYDEAVRNGTAQPLLTNIVQENKDDSVLRYKMTNVASISDVNANDYSYFYDYANKRIYFSFSAVDYGSYLMVSEADIGVRMIGTAYNMTAFGINVVGSKSTPWFIRATNYLARRNRGKFISLHSCAGIGSQSGNGFVLDRVDYELIDCVAESNAVDGKNFHYAGVGFIKGGRSWFNGDDGVSHHEDTQCVIRDHSSRYNGAGNYTPAFGATVYHYDCESVASSYLSSKPYSGKMAAISGQGLSTYAYYENCYDDQRSQSGAGYYANAQESGTTASITIINPRTRSATGQLCETSGSGTNIVKQS